MQAKYNERACDLPDAWRINSSIALLKKKGTVIPISLEVIIHKTATTKRRIMNGSRLLRSLKYCIKVLSADLATNKEIVSTEVSVVGDVESMVSLFGVCFF